MLRNLKTIHRKTCLTQIRQTFWASTLKYNWTSFMIHFHKNYTNICQQLRVYYEKFQLNSPWLQLTKKINIVGNPGVQGVCGTGGATPPPAGGDVTKRGNEFSRANLSRRFLTVRESSGRRRRENKIKFHLYTFQLGFPFHCISLTLRW